MYYLDLDIFIFILLRPLKDKSVQLNNSNIQLVVTAKNHEPFIFQIKKTNQLFKKKQKNISDENGIDFLTSRFQSSTHSLRFFLSKVGSVAMESQNQDFKPTFLNQTVKKSRTCLLLSSLQPWDNPCLPQRGQTSPCSHRRLWLVLRSAVWQSLTERACARLCPVASGAAAAAAIVDSFRLVPVSGPLVLTWIRIKKIIIIKWGTLFRLLLGNHPRPTPSC